MKIKRKEGSLLCVVEKINGVHTNNSKIVAIKYRFNNL